MAGIVSGAIESAKNRTGGAVGAGLVLVVLPSAALFFGAGRLTETPTIGLPLVAIFGIMILFGALALTATLFARLNLDDRQQALALPQGSIRAAIALALIVLFAIITILLYQTVSKPYEVKDLSEAQKSSLLKDSPQRVLAVIATCRPSASNGSGGTGNEGNKDACSEAGPPYTVHLLPPQDQGAADLAKQLLILIGTLMTSVVSFYFGSRTADAKNGNDSANQPNQPQASDVRRSEDGGDHAHTPTANPTLDNQLPIATGGVAP